MEKREFNAGQGGFGEGGRFKGRRPVTDYGSTMVQWMQVRGPRWKRGMRLEAERPSASYIVDMLPSLAKPGTPAACIPAKHLHTSSNKVKHPINVVRWTPEGRRLLTGSTSGEFTLWNGTGFNFETIMQAHDSAIGEAKWSHSDDWLLSGDQDGMVKYWQPNFNNVKVLQAHDHAVRDLSFAPTDVKFVTASDDATLKIWDFAAGAEDSTLTGHGWDVKTCDWHPTKGLLVSGSKDHQIKLWDPRNGRCLTTLHGHKNTIAKTLFEPNRGDLLATCARDSAARIFDLRMMRDLLILKGHQKDIATVCWHPFQTSLLSTGGSDGSIFHFILDEQNVPGDAVPSLSAYDVPDPSTGHAVTIYPAHKIQYAHEYTVWSMDWHPLGHLLASGANDRRTHFWARLRPGESTPLHDAYHIGQDAAEARGTFHKRTNNQRDDDELEQEDEAEGLVDQNMPSAVSGLPGITLPADAGSGTSTGGAQPLLPGMGAAPPPPPSAGLVPPPLPPGFAGLDPSKVDFSKLAEFFGNGAVPPLPIPGAPGTGNLPPPPFPPPGFNGFPQGAPPMPIPGFPPPIPGGFGMPNPTGQQQYDGSVRQRAPLPSQKDSLREEQRRGNFTRAR